MKWMALDFQKTLSKKAQGMNIRNILFILKIYNKLKYNIIKTNKLLLKKIINKFYILL